MVMSLKIFLFNKKTLIFCFFILITSFLTTIYSLTNSFAENSPIEIIDKINNIYNSNEKIAYLTFDDGPSPNITPKILDILNEENIKASFFVIGKKVKEQPNIVKRIYEEGHFIGNHSYSHDNSLLYKSKESFLSEIQKTDIEIGKAIGIENYHSFLFRFPNGFMSNIYKSKKEEYVKCLSSINYTYIDWNALNKDSEKKYSNYELLENLKNSTKNKNVLVILMHDSKDVNDSSLVLKDSIDYLKSIGYIFNDFN